MISIIENVLNPEKKQEMLDKIQQHSQNYQMGQQVKNNIINTMKKIPEMQPQVANYLVQSHQKVMQHQSDDLIKAKELQRKLQYSDQSKRAK